MSKIFILPINLDNFNFINESIFIVLINQAYANVLVNCFQLI